MTAWRAICRPKTLLLCGNWGVRFGRPSYLGGLESGVLPHAFIDFFADLTRNAK